MMQAMARGQAAGILNEAFTKAFQEQTTMSIVEWEKVEDDLLVVHPLADDDELVAALDPEAEESDEPPFGSGESKVHRFTEANAALPDDRRLRHLGPVTLRAANQTLSAELFVRREVEDDYDDHE